MILGSAIYCYYQMFQNCTSLTATPELKATTLPTGCYQSMFKGCTSLTAAYVKAAYISGYGSATSDMFDGCTATGAVLHTTTASQSSWNTNKPGANWTINADWND